MRRVKNRVLAMALAVVLGVSSVSAGVSATEITPDDGTAVVEAAVEEENSEAATEAASEEATEAAEVTEAAEAAEEAEITTEAEVTTAAEITTAAEVTTEAETEQAETTEDELTEDDILEIKEELLKEEAGKAAAERAEEIMAAAEEGIEKETFVEDQLVPVEVNEANFPDAKFREYLKTLDEYNQADNKIDPTGVGAMIVENLGISDLTGIALFKHLEYLDCSYNNIKNLDVSMCTNLSGIYCAGNSMASLKVNTNNGSLEYLDCEMNCLESLDVSNNRNLDILYCGTNKLTSLNVTNCSSLSSVDWGYNFLTRDAIQASGTSLDLSYIELNKQCYTLLKDAVLSAAQAVEGENHISDVPRMYISEPFTTDSTRYMYDEETDTATEVSNGVTYDIYNNYYARLYKFTVPANTEYKVSYSFGYGWAEIFTCDDGVMRDYSFHYFEEDAKTEAHTIRNTTSAPKEFCIMIDEAAGASDPKFTLTKTEDNVTSYITVSYKTHIQSFGTEKTWSKNGAVSGTSGKAKRLEGIYINVSGDDYLGIQYTTHCQSYGWLPWSSDGDLSGTEGEAKRLEAIKIQLTGIDKDWYDVYYRVHAQSYGWLNWAKNGEPAGTAGYAKRLEAIQIVVVYKGESFDTSMGGITSKQTAAYISNSGSAVTVNGADTPNVAYRTHVQSYGWQGWKYNGAMSGTSGEAKRLEGINIKLTNQDYSGGITYRTHVQSFGWEKEWKSDGEMSGTSGKAKRLEAIQIQLTGNMAEYYDVYYRVHAQSYGWLGWAKNGESAGTAGYAKRLEGIQIVLVPKGSEAPSASYGGVTSKTTTSYVQK